tara:strand:- start:7201 stop:7602 length:402 start_codon:yes stop_codon:yes gene_type:complete
MSTKNVVFNKLFKAKTELSKKVDLSLIGDIDDAIQEAESTRINWDNTLTDLYAELFDVVDRFKNSENLYNEFDLQVENVKTLFSNLKDNLIDVGVDVNNIPLTTDIQSFLNRSNDVYAEQVHASGIFNKIRQN